MSEIARVPSTRRMPIVPRCAWLIALAAIIAMFLLVTDARNAAVTLPLTVVLIASSLFYWVLWRRRRGIVPWFELGAVYVMAVTLYAVYPLIGYLAVGQTYTALNDVRLWLFAPTPPEIGHIAWLYVCHLTGFALVYLIVRGRLGVSRSRFSNPSTAVFVAVGAMYLVIQAFWIILGLFYDMSAATYMESYLVSRRLPLVFAQLVNHLAGVNGVKYTLSIVLLAALFGRYPASRRLIVGWIVLTAAVTITRLGSRTELVLLVIAGMMMYNDTVRPVSSRLVAVAAAIGLAGFLVFGIARNMGSVDGQVLFNPFAYASEFEILFGNAFDLVRMQADGTLGDLPPGFHVADITALIPQQLAPFQKVDPAEWYVRTFYPVYAAQGGGLAFGTIAEAVVSGGWPSALARGAALGFCFAHVHRFYVRHADSSWVYVFYVWIATLSYQCFRNRTFSLLVLIVFRFLPAMIGVTLLATLLARAARFRASEADRRFLRAST